MIFLAIFAAIFGGFWRVVDGSDHAPKHWHLLPVPFILAAVVYGYYSGNYSAAIGLVVAYISLLDGFNGWHRFDVMDMRYTGYAGIAAAAASLSNWYILVGLVAGLCYPTIHWLYGKGLRLPHVGIFNNYNPYCEVISGALMFGGVLYFL